MIFSSVQFLFVFLPVTLLGFHLLCLVSHRAAAAWLALASLAFYAAWRLDFLPILLISITFNYGMGHLLSRADASPARQRAIMTLAVGANILALFYFKYIAATLGWFGYKQLGVVSLADIVLPLGISFFTFTQIGYLVDVRDKVARERDPLSYLLFVTFFPHLIAGPILHNGEMVPQFRDRNTYRFNAENLTVGLTILIIGMAKKLVLADPLALPVREAFDAHHHIGLFQAWYGVVLYSFQLYFDFSGYSDMAIGIARMFNVRFPLNFASPYRSRNIIDFWNRWHMTLTRFITDYIYNPLALAIMRRRMDRDLPTNKAALRTWRGFMAMVGAPTLVTMGLAGIWHGAGLQYLIFGLLHGSYIAFTHFVRARRKKLPKGEVEAPAGPGRIFGEWAAVYIGVLVGFCFFRASSTGAAFDMLGGMAGLGGLGPVTIKASFAARIVLAAFIIWVLPNTQQFMQDYRPALGKIEETGALKLRWSPTLPWAIAIALLAAAGLAWMGSPSEFLYFQF